ncbi:MAG: YjbH domain-containing protein [Armatimonadetes bacterium]|nr:YjbH domain-containing protein [Armatimonadota bacterium]
MVTFLSLSGRTRTAWLCLAVVTLWSAAGTWARAEFVEYPQYRYVSGLPGNGYGVTADGQVGWDGAMSQCIPLGYTPSNGSVAVSYLSGSRSGGFKVGFSGKDVDGTLPITIGFGPKGHGVAVTADFVDNEWDIAMHAQGQVLKETKSRPAVSIGVLDWANRREATLGHFAERGARSVYIAATKAFDAGSRPLHVTLGVGTNRFGDGPFVGACYDVHDRVKVLAEYDGLGVNAAAAAQLLPQKRGPGLDKQEGPGRADALNLFLGVADMEYPVVGLTYARKGVF